MSVPFGHHDGHAGPRLSCLALVVLLLSSIVLAGCAPTADPTLPPATAVSASASDTPEPAAPTATLAATQSPATIAATTVPTQPSANMGSRQAATLTILHTNDVVGETDPCG